MAGVATSEPNGPSWAKPRSSSTMITTLGDVEVVARGSIGVRSDRGSASRRSGRRWRAMNSAQGSPSSTGSHDTASSTSSSSRRSSTASCSGLRRRARRVRWRCSGGASNTSARSASMHRGGVVVEVFRAQFEGPGLACRPVRPLARAPSAPTGRQRLEEPVVDQRAHVVERGGRIAAQLVGQLLVGQLGVEGEPDDAQAIGVGHGPGLGQGGASAGGRPAAADRLVRFAHGTMISD